MAYIGFEEYIDISYRDTTYNVFAKVEKEAERYIDKFTMTVDGIKKLKFAFPTVVDDINAVKECMVALIDALDDLAVAENAVREANKAGRSGVIASVSSGSESISYATSLNSDLAIAASSSEAKSAYLYRICRDYLNGARDANGVNLLYGGVYPCI